MHFSHNGPRRLGSHVAEALLEKGYEVHGVVRPRSNLRNVAAFQSKVGLTFLVSFCLFFSAIGFVLFCVSFWFCSLVLYNTVQCIFDLLALVGRLGCLLFTL